MRDQGSSAIEERYLDVLAAIDAEFSRNRRLHGEKIHCRAGCDDCCHQFFHITEAHTEPEVEPNAVRNDLLREPMATVTGCPTPIQNRIRAQPLNLTVPIGVFE